MTRTLTSDLDITSSELGLSQCVWCRHRWANGQRCEAFPNGIPEAIIRNRHDHREAYDGDSGVRFEPEEVEIEFVDPDDDIAPPRADSGRSAEAGSWDDDEVIELEVVDVGIDFEDLDVLRL